MAGKPHSLIALTLHSGPAHNIRRMPSATICTLRASPPAFQLQPMWWTVVCLAALIGWDMAGLDRTLAGGFGTPLGFALRDHWLLVKVAHEGGRQLAWVATGLLIAGIAWPLGALRTIDRYRRIQLAASVLVALGAVALIKLKSTTSCPWELQDFGGAAHYASHWAFWQTDGGGGHCFPAGHASAGFAFIAGYFVFRDSQPRTAGCWLAVALLAGFALGLAQQARGAHFMSHTLWTAWFCWLAAWTCDLLFRAARKTPLI